MLLQVLGWIVVVVPLVATLVFIFIPDPKENPLMHKIWKGGFVTIGVVYSAVVWYQQTLQRSAEQAEAKAFRESLAFEQRNNKERVDALTASVNAHFAKLPRQRAQNGPSPIRVPTAEEIAEALEKKLKSAQPSATPIRATDTVVAVTAVPTPIPTPHPCVGDHLNECSTEQLLAWGKPLADKMDRAVNAYMADLKKLDDIKEAKGNWFKDFVGIGPGPHDNWLKAYALAQETAAENFRNCCAENAVAYHQALASRVGGGNENREVYDWVEKLLKPTKSKEYKAARDDLGKMIVLNGDIRSFQINLEFGQRARK